MLWKEMLNVFDKFEKMRIKLKLQWKLGFDWPITQIYEKTSGVIPWKVYTIWAYSNVWKSKFAYYHIAYFLKQKKKVLIINLEVDAEHCLMNIIQAVENKSVNEMMDFTLTDENIEIYENLMIKDNLYRLEEITKCIEEVQPDIVFIDFVQNIQAQWWWAYEQNALIAKTIQRTAIQTKSVIYSLSQVSNEMWRNISNENLDFVALKGSWEYFASSDVIILLRRWVEPWEMLVRLVKNKFWPNWVEMVLNVDFARNQFTYLRWTDDY